MMGRLLSEKIVVTGQLIAQSPIHIGGDDVELFADMMLARNGADELYIPGTSLAGPMRTWMADHFAASLDSLFGPSREKKSDPTSASLIRVKDAVAQNAIAELRDHVGIDRWSGTAADGIKYDREVIPAGSIFNFEVELEIPNSDVDANTLKSSFAALMKRMSETGLRLGAATTRGLGLVRLAQAKAKTIDFKSKDAVLNFLQNKPDETTEAFADLIAHAAMPIHSNPAVTIKINWTSEQSVFVKDGREGHLISAIPLTTGAGDDVKIVLPGSSLKGALRSHAEKIIRTLSGANLNSENDWAKSLEPDPIIGVLFGSKNSGDKGSGRQSAVFVEDCIPNDQAVIKRADMSALFTQPVTDNRAAETRILLDKSGLKQMRVETRNAIDRWTGGAAASMLFTTLEPGAMHGTFELTFDRRRAGYGHKDGVNQADCALALLLLVVRDMKAGLIPIGYGVNRGYGSITVESVEVMYAPAAPENAELKGELSTLNGNGFDDLKTAWETFAKSLVETSKEAA